MRLLVERIRGENDEGYVWDPDWKIQVARGGIVVDARNDKDAIRQYRDRLISRADRGAPEPGERYSITPLGESRYVQVTSRRVAFDLETKTDPYSD